MTVGGSKAATTITHKPALAPSPQPRPAPTVRALPSAPATLRGPFWMPIRGPIPTPIDILRSLTPAGKPVKHLIAISGPAAGGKSVLDEEALQRFSAHSI